MNKVILLGRLTKDPEIKYTANNNTAVCNFTLAVNRRKKGEADFINCQAWDKTAEFVGKYFQKGQQVAITGRIQTRTWDDNDGKRRYVTEVVAEECFFADSKRESNQGAGNSTSTNNANSAAAGGFETYEDDELPF